jgi:hypothetical protein
MDALKTIHSNYFIFSSVSEQENKSFSKEAERENYNMFNIDLEGNYCSFHDNLTIKSQPSLNKFLKDNSFSNKTERVNYDRENGNNFEDNHREKTFFNNEIDKNEEELLNLQEFECNGNKIEDIEKDEYEIKKEEKNTMQKVNDTNIFRRKIKDIKPDLKNKINKTDFLDNNKYKDFDNFLDKIREEEEENNIGNIEEYINDIKKLCLHFEEWFEKKIGRNRANNEK